MNNFSTYALGPRLLAGFGTLTLLTGIGLLSSRPGHTTGGPVPVTVTNSIQNRDSSARQPVDTFMTINGSGLGSASNLVYKVPAGKQLVVESVTFASELLDDPNTYTCQIINKDSTATLLSLAELSIGPGTNVIPSVTQPVTLHVRPNGSVLATVYQSGSGSFTVQVSLVGYLVDVP